MTHVVVNVCRRGTRATALDKDGQPQFSAKQCCCYTLTNRVLDWAGFACGSPAKHRSVVRPTVCLSCLIEESMSVGALAPFA